MRSLARVLAVTSSFVLLLASGAVSQDRQSSSLRGSWSATIGSRPGLQGTWSAELNEKTPNRATGTWTLVDARSTVIARGTWSATRSSGTWSGTWSARAATGAVRSGTWRADAASGPPSFADLLRSTLEKQLTGAWHSAGLQGAWALRATSRD